MMKPTVAIGIPLDAGRERLDRTLTALCRDSALIKELFLLPGTQDSISLTKLEVAPDLSALNPIVSCGGATYFNQLARASRADVIVLLENGAIVGPGWLDRMLAALQNDVRNGLAGPSTNRSWNEQCVFPDAELSSEEAARISSEAMNRFGASVKTLEPLYSLGDFCYAVKREVIDTIGPADEGYGLGPCWEMDYNIRAARAGWRGVWVCGAYVHRAPFTERRQRDEARLFETSKRRYQDRFCGGHLRGLKTDYRSHCRGDACPNFAPAHLIQIKNPPVLSPPVAPAAPPAAVESRARVIEEIAPLVTCIMPTFDRQRFVPEAVRLFLRQDYPNLELVIVDDGSVPVAPLLPDDARIRLIRLAEKKNIGAKRNLACTAARGEFIVHWDDDDWYPADRVTRQIAALRERGAEICGSSTLYYHDAGTGRAWCYRYRNNARPWVGGNTLAYRKSWWAARPFPEIRLGEDTRFVWAAQKHAVCDLAAADICVARIHAKNTSRKTTAGSSWHRCAVADLQAILGSDWPAFSSQTPIVSAGPDFPLVSCIMPTYNRRHFLALSLKAFEAQDYPAKELIVIDDGSDPVADLVEGISTARYFRLPARTSIGAKRNLACREARGAIIAHWDDDDWYAPSRLRCQVAPLLRGEAELTGLETSFVFDAEARQLWTIEPSLHRRMFAGDVHGGTLVYWKQLIADGIHYPCTNLAEDAAFLRSALRRGKRLARVANNGLFVYVRHSGNAWRFQPGRFLDPTGWKLGGVPRLFGDAEREAWQQAAGAPSRSR